MTIKTKQTRTSLMKKMKWIQKKKTKKIRQILKKTKKTQMTTQQTSLKRNQMTMNQITIQTITKKKKKMTNKQTNKQQIIATFNARYKLECGDLLLGCKRFSLINNSFATYILVIKHSTKITGVRHV